MFPYAKYENQLCGAKNEALHIARDVALKRVPCTRTGVLTDVDTLHNAAVFDRFREDVVLNRDYMFEDARELLYSVVIVGDEIPSFFQHAYHVKTRPQNYDDGRGDKGGDQCAMDMKAFAFYLIDGDELVRITNALVLAFYIPGETNAEWLDFF